MKKKSVERVSATRICDFQKNEDIKLAPSKVSVMRAICIFLNYPIFVGFRWISKSFRRILSGWAKILRFRKIILLVRTLVSLPENNYCDWIGDNQNQKAQKLFRLPMRRFYRFRGSTSHLQKSSQKSKTTPAQNMRIPDTPQLPRSNPTE